MASAFYPHIFKHMVKGDVDLDPVGSGGDTVRVMLLGPSYVYDANHEFVSDVVANELADNGTTTIGYERKDVSVTLDVDINANTGGAGTDDADAGVFIEFDLDGDARWTEATFTVRHAVMFVAGADDATSKLLYYFDLVNNQIVSSGTFALLNPQPQPKIRRYSGA